MTGDKGRGSVIYRSMVALLGLAERGIRFAGRYGLRAFVVAVKNFLLARLIPPSTKISAKKILSDGESGSHIEPPGDIDIYQLAYKAALIASSSGQDQADFVPISEMISSPSEPPIKLVAFYLPQFHPIPENDEWWGRGFTEWTNVSKAVPQFVGHYQPHLPGELGFYDLRVPDVQQRQIELARSYGIHGFAFYYYWFHGKRLLEKPIDQFFENKELDFPFCIFWANENWTRRWDGKEEDVLIRQEHSAESDLAFIQDVERYLRDERYIRVDGKPLLMVYRVELLPHPLETVGIWRDYCRQSGIGEIFLVAGQVYGFRDPRPVGFDAAVEFPPHNCTIVRINHSVQVLNPGYEGHIYRYADFANHYMSKPRETAYDLFRTVSPGWDNEARKPGRGSTFAFSTPAIYQRWLTEMCTQTMNKAQSKRLVFINAWNEWAEGAHLEPDRRFGYAYLQATWQALHAFDGLARKYE